MIRYLKTIIIALALLPGGAQAASTLHWVAGPHGTVSKLDGNGNPVQTVSGSDVITESLTNYQGSAKFRATAADGYRFLNYSSSNGSQRFNPERTASVVSFTDDGNVHDNPITITANFSNSLDQYDLLTHGVPSEAAEVQAGRSHTVILKKNGTVVAWGGDDGQSDPELATLTGVTAVGAGLYTTFVVTNGTVKGYGKFADNLAVSNLPVFVPTPAPTNVVALASGLSHAVALKSDGTVEVWGVDTGFGQLIIPADLYVSKATGNPVKVTAISAGNNFTVTLMEDGNVRGWGENAHGELTGIPSASGRKIIAISAKVWHGIALYDDGTVFCWGQNDLHQGNVPAGLNNVTAIAAGGHHSVALKKDGTVIAWGGNPASEKSGVPEGFVPAGTGGTTLIAAGYYHTVAVTPAAVLGWGNNDGKQCEAPVRAYAAVTNGTLSCQTSGLYSTLVNYGSSSVCTITPNANQKTFVAINGVQRTVPDGPTTTTISNIQGFQTVTAAFGVAPDAPTVASVTAANGQATVTITAPVNNGGSPITGYTVKTKTPSVGIGVDSDAGTTRLVHTITGLTSGTGYTFTATATNLLGTSPDSVPSQQPQAITVKTPAPATAQYGASFTVDASAPGGAVSYSSAGGCTNSGALFNMTSALLTCTVKYDQGGDATYAAASQITSDTAALKADQAISITAAKVPPASAPYGSSFTVDATAPGGAVSYSSTGGCSNVGATFTMTSITTPCTVRYDQGGSADYNAAAQVTSQTAVGKAGQSITITAGKGAPTSAVFGTSFTVDATAPGGAVSYGSAGGCSNAGPVFTMTSGTTACTVRYEQGGSSGYAATQASSQTAATKAEQSIAITSPAPASATVGASFNVAATAPGGTVTYSGLGGCSNSGATFTITSAGTDCTVRYDQGGNADYATAPQKTSTTKVVASAAPGAPGAPTAVSASAVVNGQASVAFSAPASNGGSAITGYTVTASPGSIIATGSQSPILVTGLTNGTAYSFTVTASNAAGTGIPSVASAAVTPLANGDVNGDGAVDVADALFALRLSAGLENPTAAHLLRVDVAPLVNGTPKGDGKIDLGDVIVILRKIVGQISW